MKKYYIIILFLLFVFLIVGCDTLPSSIVKSEYLEITNTKGKVSALGELVWEGDITNKGTIRIDNVTIDITCYSESRETVGKATTNIKYIEPGETLHFTANGVGQYAENIKCESKIK